MRLLRNARSGRLSKREKREEKEETPRGEGGGEGRGKLGRYQGNNNNQTSLWGWVYATMMKKKEEEERKYYNNKTSTRVIRREIPLDFVCVCGGGGDEVRWDKSAAAHITCQIIIPILPSYVPTCNNSSSSSRDCSINSNSSGLFLGIKDEKFEFGFDFVTFTTCCYCCYLATCPCEGTSSLLWHESSLLQLIASVYS